MFNTVQQIINNAQGIKLDTQAFGSNIKLLDGWGKTLGEQHAVLRDINEDVVYVLFSDGVAREVLACGTVVNCTNCMEFSESTCEFVAARMYSIEEFKDFLVQYYTSDAERLQNIKLMEKLEVL